MWIQTLITLYVCLLPLLAADSNLHVIKSYSMPGEGSWDYVSVDAAARRIYVSHASQVQVVNADTGEVVGTLPGTKGVHGIALVPSLNKGFTSNGQSNTVTMFDLKTLAPLAEIPTAKKPDAIFYDPASKRVFANNGGSASTTAIDVETGKVAGEIALEGQPEFGASDGAGQVYINLEDKSEMVAIDSKSLKVVHRWPLAPCEAPASLAIDTKTKRLFAGCRNHKMVVVDATSGKILDSQTIGDHVDATVFDAKSSTVYFSNGDGTVDIFKQKGNGYEKAPSVTTEAGAKTMAMDPKTGFLFLPTAKYEQVNGKRSVVAGSFHLLVVGP